MFGYSLEMLYLTVLIVSGCCAVLYLIFADITIEGVPFLDPAVILSFITFTSAAGYLLGHFANLSDWIVIILALVIAILFTTAIYYFLLVPIRSAEVSLVYTDQSLEGQLGKIIVPIPIDGFGEMIIETTNGIISKRAVSYKGGEIPYDARVLIIEVRDGTAYVVLYEKEF